MGSLPHAIVTTPGEILMICSQLKKREKNWQVNLVQLTTQAFLSHYESPSIKRDRFHKKIKQENFPC